MCVCVCPGEGGGVMLLPHPQPPFPPYCVGRIRRAKVILACMESRMSISELDLPFTSLEESKV